jgi:imidazolonepropionase-like amidohydrolase
MNKQQTLLIVFFIVAFVFSRAPKKNYGDCLFIKAGRIFDGQNNRYLQKKYIHIQSGKIVSVSENSTPPDECRVLDASRKTLLAGLIDSHTHLLLGSKDFRLKLEAIIEKSLKMSDRSHIQMGLENARAMLFSGFTTARDLGNSGHFLDVELRKLIEKNPKLGPRLIISGPGLAIYPTQAGKKTIEYREIETEEDIKKALAENVN